MAEESSRDQLEALFEMARSKSTDARRDLAAAVRDLFSGENEVLSDRERALMSDILRRLVHAAEISVRRSLSARLSGSRGAPRELDALLGNDELEIAHPILIDSEVLHDSDLVEAILHRTFQHQLATAMRRSLNEGVGGALVEGETEDVLRAMLDDANARVSRTTREYLVEQSKRVDTYQNPLLFPPELGADLTRRIHWWVSAALRKHIVENFDVDPVALDADLEDTVKDILARQSEEGRRPTPLALAEHLDREEGISSQLMVKVLRQGEVPLLEAMLATRSGLRPKLLRRLLYEPGGEALAVVFKGIDAPKSDFATVLMLTRKARSGGETMTPKELSRIFEFYERVRPEVAKAMLSRWRRDPEFLNAERIILQGPGGGNRIRGGGGPHRGARMMDAGG